MSEYSNSKIEKMTSRERKALIDIVKNVKYIWVFFKDSKKNDIQIQIHADSASDILNNNNGYQYALQIRNEAPGNFANLIIL